MEDNERNDTGRPNSNNYCYYFATFHPISLLNKQTLFHGKIVFPEIFYISFKKYEAIFLFIICH